MRTRLVSFCISAAVVLLLAGAANAETFTAYLTSEQEVPANASTARGYARVFLNEATGTITFTVVFDGLSSAQSGAHIHAPAAIGVNAGVAVDFGTVGGTSGTITGTRTLTPTQIAQIRAHQGYVNVHSANFPGGEIRGQLGARRPVDYDGDGRTDLSVLRFPGIAPPGVAPITYWNLNSTTGVQTAMWGDANRDFPAPGDFDGDARDDFSLYRSGAQSEFWISRSSDAGVQYYAWGIERDEAVARDYDGDGITDVAVFRPGTVAGQTAGWFILQSATNTVRIAAFGTTGNSTGSTGDRPVPGDYDGDGKFDLAVYRFGGLAPNNTFIVLRSSDGVITYRQWGNFTTDYIVPGDYDGDGKFDYAAARTGALSTSPLVWWILNSSTGTSRTQTFGRTSDFPAQGDYDGDARTDIAIYRPGATAGSASNYWILRSMSNSAQVAQWGLGSDFSVNTFDIR